MIFQRTGLILFVHKYQECVSFYRDILLLPIMFDNDALTCFKLGESYLLVEIDDENPEPRSENEVNEGLLDIKRIILKNGYPNALIDKHLKEKRHDKVYLTCEKLNVFLNLPYRGKVISQFIKSKVSKAIGDTYPAAKLNLLSQTRRIWISSVKDKISFESNSKVIYKFKCSCDLEYIERTRRRLGDRIKEHIPASFLRGNTNLSSTSSICKNLFDSRCEIIDIKKSFSIVGRARTEKLLSILEGVLINRIKPAYVVKKPLFMRFLFLGDKIEIYFSRMYRYVCFMIFFKILCISYDYIFIVYLKNLILFLY